MIWIHREIVSATNGIRGAAVIVIAKTNFHLATEIENPKRLTVRGVFAVFPAKQNPSRNTLDCPIKIALLLA